MSKFLDIMNILNGLSTNVKIFLAVIIVAMILTKLTPGEKES